MINEITDENLSMPLKSRILASSTDVTSLTQDSEQTTLETNRTHMLIHTGIFFAKF